MLWKCLMILQNNTNFNLFLGSNVTLTWSGLFINFKNRWLNNEIINACIDLFQQNLENQHHNKIIVHKTFFQQYIKANHLQVARNILYGNKYQKNTQNFFHDHNTLLFVINSNNTHWNLLYLNISAKVCYIIDSKNSIKPVDAYRIISFLCAFNDLSSDEDAPVSTKQNQSTNVNYNISKSDSYQRDMLNDNIENQMNTRTQEMVNDDGELIYKYM